MRAAMSCVKFYEDKATSFSDLLQRKHYLTEALGHLSRGREQEQWVAVTTGVMSFLRIASQKCLQKFLFEAKFPKKNMFVKT